MSISDYTRRGNFLAYLCLFSLVASFSFISISAGISSSKLLFEDSFDKRVLENDEQIANTTDLKNTSKLSVVENNKVIAPVLSNNECSTETCSYNSNINDQDFENRIKDKENLDRCRDIYLNGYNLKEAKAPTPKSRNNYGYDRSFITDEQRKHAYIEAVWQNMLSDIDPFTNMASLKSYSFLGLVIASFYRGDRGSLETLIRKLTSNFYYVPSSSRSIGTAPSDIFKALIISTVAVNILPNLLSTLKSLPLWFYGRLWKEYDPAKAGLMPAVEFYALKSVFQEEQKKNTLDADVVLQLEDLFKAAEVNIFGAKNKRESSNNILVSFDSGGGGENSRAMKSLVDIQLVLNLPYRPLKLRDSESIVKDIEPLISNYAETTQDELKRLVSQLSQISHEESLGTEITRNLYYFVGAPGTGKTHLVREFAHKVGVPLIELNLKSVKSVEDLFGDCTRYNNEGAQKISKFVESLTSLPQDKRYNNAIIFLDEVDKIFGNIPKGFEAGQLEMGMLQFLDPSKKTVQLCDIGLNKFDISRFTFVLAGNREIKRKEMKDRLKRIKFGGFSLEKREDIACHLFSKKIGMKEKEIFSSDSNLKEVINLAQIDSSLNIGVRNLEKTLASYSSHLKAKRNGNFFDKNFDLDKIHRENSEASWDPFSAFHFLQLDFDKVEDLLDVEVRDKVRGHLDIINTEYLGYASLQDNDGLEDLKEYMRNVRRLINLPREIKPISDSDQMLRKNLEELLLYYSDNLKRLVVNLLQSHITKTAFTENKSHKLGGARLLKNVAYFYGKPGTGKTFLAEGIGKALNLPVVRLNLEQAKGPARSAFTFKSDRFTFKKHLNLNLFTQALLNEGKGESIPKNAIIFIDEVDKVLNDGHGSSSHEQRSLSASLLKLIDPNSKRFVLHDLGVSIDISNYLFIFAGNDKINDVVGDEEHNAGNSAFHNRMVNIEFEGFKREFKHDIAEQRFRKLADSYSLDVSDLHIEQVKNIVEFDTEELKHKNLRSLNRCLDFYIGHLYTQSTGSKSLMNSLTGEHSEDFDYRNNCKE